MKKSLRLVAIGLLALFLIAGQAIAEQATDAQKLSLTTGLPTDKEYKPVQVTFDNEPGARPVIGLSHADIVYEFEAYIGGYTRYLAIFNDDTPKNVEGCRSTRIPALEMYWNFGGAIAHYGGVTNGEASVTHYISKLGVDAEFDGIKGDSHFHRDSKRKAPHNAVVELQSMVEDTPTVEERQMLAFSADSPTIKGEDVKEFAISYRKKGGYYPSYKYDAEKNVYNYYFNGKQVKDGLDKKPVSFSNVIIIKHKYWFEQNESNRPMIDSTGTHTVEYFIGGKHFTGTCERESIFTTTKFLDDEGNEVKFLPGKTFIQLPSETRDIEYIA